MATSVTRPVAPPDALPADGDGETRKRKRETKTVPPSTAPKKRGRGRPKKSAPRSYPPPPPPPPPPAGNPYYEKFFADYWKKYSQGYKKFPGGLAPPPLPPNAAGDVPILPPLPAVPPMIPPPAPPNAPATRFPGHLPTGEYPCDKTDRETYVLATPADPEHLSGKQCYVRTRLCEIFLSNKEDVDRSVRRRRAGFVGQVGLRCVFCVPALERKSRVERALCYPTRVDKFYQTVQDMQHFHFMSCPAIPPQVRECYVNQRANMNAKRGEGKIAPRDYWTKCAEEVGMVDNIGDDGTNAGVRLKEDHKLVKRSTLPQYAQELFMPPDPEEEEDKEKEVKEEEKEGENEEDAGDGEGDNSAESEDEAGLYLTQENGEGDSDEQDDDENDDEGDGDDLKLEELGEAVEMDESDGGNDDAESQSDEPEDDAAEKDEVDGNQSS